jgi:antimicrobial peptide system SdpA family protein
VLTSRAKESAVVTSWRRRDPALSSFLIAVVVLFAGFWLSIYSVLPQNVLSRSTRDPALIQYHVIWPQGWGFFTKNPESVTVDAYAVQDGKVATSLLRTPQGLPQNSFGLSRTQRAQGPEIANLDAALPKSAWVSCTPGQADCLSKATARKPVDVVNSSPLHSVCGDVILASEKPVPWAFRDQVSTSFTVTSAAHAHVTCKEG